MIEWRKHSSQHRKIVAVSPFFKHCYSPVNTVLSARSLKGFIGKNVSGSNLAHQTTAPPGWLRSNPPSYPINLAKRQARVNSSRWDVIEDNMLMLCPPGSGENGKWPVRMELVISMGETCCEGGRG